MLLDSKTSLCIYLSATYLLLGTIQVLLIHLRAQVSRVAVVLHQLVNMANRLVENVSRVRFGLNVFLRDLIRFGVDIDRTIGIWWTSENLV